MLKLAERYPDRPEGEWPALFHRILHSRIMDWFRRNKVRGRWRVWLAGGEERGDPLENQPAAPSVGPEHGAAREQMTQALEAALHALPARQQQAFLLRAWEGLDVAQTASAMGCSQGSVKTHYSRAVHALRGRLAEHRLTG